MGPSDESSEIWHEFTEGNQQALLKLYELHYVNLMNYGARITNNREFTNDCLMEMLIDLWDKRGTLPPVDNIKGYLNTCLRRMILSKYKQQKWQNSKHTDIALQTQRFESPYEDYLTALQTNDGVKSIIIKSLENLTDRQKQLLQLKFFDDYTYNEIAEICSITKRTAYNIVHDALKILKADLVRNKINQSSLDLTLTLIGVFLIHHQVLTHIKN
jgi:RNA polymerase sigma factor (sigma-70 family)